MEDLAGAVVWESPALARQAEGRQATGGWLLAKSGPSTKITPPMLHRHCVRAVKEMDSKSIGLCPQGFESPRCRFASFGLLARLSVAFCKRLRSAPQTQPLPKQLPRHILRIYQALPTHFPHTPRTLRTHLPTTFHSIFRHSPHTFRTLPMHFPHTSNALTVDMFCYVIC